MPKCPAFKCGETIGERQMCCGRHYGLLSSDLKARIYHAWSTRDAHTFNAALNEADQYWRRVDPDVLDVEGHEVVDARTLPELNAGSAVEQSSSSPGS